MYLPLSIFALRPCGQAGHAILTTMYTEQTNARNTLFLFFMALLPAALLVAGLGCWYKHEKDSVVLEHYQVEARHHVEDQINRVQRFYKQGIGMLLALAHNKSLNIAVAGNANARREVAEVFRDVMNASDMYDKIELLNSMGQEMVSVECMGDRTGDHARVVPDAQLKNERARYYVRWALALPGGAAYVSPFDLDMEHGKVRRPYKFTVHFVTPIMDNNGRKSGIVIINMPGNSLMQRELSDTVLEGEHLLTNAGSLYWFDRQVNQLHVLKGINDVVRSHRFPKGWSRALREDKSQYVTMEGQFTIGSTEPILPDTAPKTLILPRWQIVSFVPAKALNMAISASAPHILAICAIAIALLGFIIWLWSQRHAMKHVAMQTIRHSEARLKLAEKDMDMGYWDWNMVSDTVTWSDGFNRIFGFNGAHVTPSFDTAAPYMHPDDRESLKMAIVKTIHSNARLETEFRIMKEDGKEHSIHGSGKVIFTKEAMPVRMFGTIHDITERKRTERALHAKEHRLSVAQSVARMGFLDWNLETNGIELSDMIYELLGIEPRDGGYTVNDIVALIHPDDRDFVKENLDLAVHGKKNYDIEHRMVQSDDTIVWVHARGELFLEPDGNPVCFFGTVIDITQRKQVEQQREVLLKANRRLVQGLIQAREEERTMLARTLHDDIGQKLTAIQMYAAAVTSQCSGKTCPAAKHGMRTIQDIATGLIETVRGQLKQLRPPQLDQLGVKAALASLCSDWENSSGVPCRLNVDDTVDTLDDAEQLNLYRIVQEGLTNVARHARASRVYVNLKLKEDGIHLTLRDDGCGFDPSAQTEGIGLTGMRERMDLLGGSMRVESAAGKGTRLIFHCNLIKPDLFSTSLV